MFTVHVYDIDVKLDVKFYNIVLQIHVIDGLSLPLT